MSQMSGADTGRQVIEKVHPGSFSETPLHDYLRGAGDKKIVLCGYMAHVCVSTTAREGAQLGYDVILAEDAIGDRDIPGASGVDVTKVPSISSLRSYGP